MQVWPEIQAITQPVTSDEARFENLLGEAVRLDVPEDLRCAYAVASHTLECLDAHASECPEDLLAPLEQFVERCRQEP